MATYFLVGGGTGGTVDLGDPAIWSLTSGGAGGAGIPSSGDTANINTASGTNFFVQGTLGCDTLTVGLSATPIFTVFTNIFIDRNLTLSTTSQVQGSSFYINNVLSGITTTVNMAGVNLNNALVSINCEFAPSRVNLAGNVTNAGSFSLYSADDGIISTAGFTITCSAFDLNSAFATLADRILLGASSITGTNSLNIQGESSLATAVNFNSATLITNNLAEFDGLFTPSTSIVRCISATTPTTLYSNFPAGVSNLNTVQLQGDYNQIRDINMATLTKTTNANINGVLELQSDITVTGTATFTGNSTINRLLVTSPTLTSPYTITAATTSITNTDFRDITAAGAAAWTGTSVGNWLGNTGITFTPAVTRYAVAAGNWASTALWSATNGGASGATIPLAQDTAIINNLSGSGVIQVNNTNAMCADLQVQSGFAGSLSIEMNSYVFGSITTGSGAVATTSLGIDVNLVSRGTIGLSYGNQTSLSVAIFGPLTTNINSNIGSAGNTTNKFINYSSTFNTNGYTIYTEYIANGGGVFNLGASEIFAYGTCTLGVMSANTSSIFLMTSTTINGTYLFNVNIAFTTVGQFVGLAAGGGTIRLYGTITDRNLNYPATQDYLYKFSQAVEFQTSSTWDLANGSGRVATVDNATFVNNSTRPLQTLTATFINCTASGTFSGNDFRAFGAANFGGNTGITFPSTIKTYAFYNSSAQSFTIPADYSGSAIITAIGGGGTGVTGSGGGGGGAYASSKLFTYSKNQTVFISNTTPGNDAWINTSNSPTSSLSLGVLAKAGSSGASRTGGSATLSLGSNKVQGGNGGTGTAGGGGGGSSATILSRFNGGNGGTSRTANNGAGGGGGITGAALNVSSQNGTAGGNPNGGTAGVGGASSTAGGNATLNSGGGGGGAGGGYSQTTSTKTGTYSRASQSTTLTMDINNHQMTNGGTYSFTFTAFKTGTYSKASASGTAPTTITISGGHGLSNGENVYIDFTSGNLSARDGYYAITFISATQFSVVATPALTTTASGNITLRPAPSGTSFAVTVVNANQITVTTTSDCVIPATAVSSVVTVINFDRPGLQGGDASYRPDYTFDYLNGAEISGTAGPSGGAGGGSASSGFNGGNAGSFVGLVYAAGGGGGSGGLGVVNGSSSNGAPGLVLFTYALAPPPSQGFSIG